MVYDLFLGKSFLADVQNAADWYGSKSLPTLDKFLDSVDARLLDLRARPSSFSHVRLRPVYRRVKLRKFPYLLVFRLDEAKKRVFISALVHEKSNPADWARRLR